MSWCYDAVDPVNGNQFCFNFCGGSIYNETTIITAAHCCVGFDDPDSLVGWNDLKIVAGELDLLSTSNFEQVRKIKSHIVHPDYDATSKKNDICLLTLETALQFNDNVKKVPIDTVGPSNGQLCTVSGWGTLTV